MWVILVIIIIVYEITNAIGIKDINNKIDNLTKEIQELKNNKKED